MRFPPPIHDRLDWLRAFRDEIRRHQPELRALESAEVGKTDFEALTADIMPLLASCAWHLKNARRLLGPRRVRGGGIFGLHLFGLGTHASRHRLPVGRVLIIATWNYPVQLVGVQLVQAVVAGNEVVVKPSERAPRTQARLLELAVACAERIPSMRG
ncbi:MAG: aldehyde dehydrogenase family protein, partial [Planctomycetaceae bacterium]|nr:aldehyde dehydrogenase family protein [Planctomycetaceae bacterium]